MSTDIKIQNNCDHLINWEQLNFEADMRTIYPSYFIASVSSLSLRINNVIIDATNYVIASRTTEGPLDPPLYVYMNSKNRLYLPIVEMQYTVPAAYCPKCVGLKVLDDLIYSPYGDIAITSKEALLVQNLEKYIVTNIGSNVFVPWVGTSIVTLIGSKITDPAITKSRIVEQVNDAINKLKSVQSQLQNANRTLDPGEIFDRLLGIDVQNTDDPTIVFLTVSFTAKSGNTLEYSQYIELSYLRQIQAFTS